VSKNHFTLFFFHTIIAVIITSILQIAAGNSNQIKKTALIILRSYYHKAPRWYFSGVLALQVLIILSQAEAAYGIACCVAHLNRQIISQLLFAYYSAVWPCYYKLLQAVFFSIVKSVHYFFIS